MPRATAKTHRAYSVTLRGFSPIRVHVVHLRGLEPPRPLGHMPLKHACLPIPPQVQCRGIYNPPGWKSQDLPGIMIVVQVFWGGLSNTWKSEPSNRDRSTVGYIISPGPVAVLNATVVPGFLSAKK